MKTMHDILLDHDLLLHYSHTLQTRNASTRLGSQVGEPYPTLDWTGTMVSQTELGLHRYITRLLEMNGRGSWKGDRIHPVCDHLDMLNTRRLTTPIIHIHIILPETVHQGRSQQVGVDMDHEYNSLFSTNRRGRRQCNDQCLLAPTSLFPCLAHSRETARTTVVDHLELQAWWMMLTRTVYGHLPRQCLIAKEGPEL